jgi:hypothetical protein
MADCLITGTVKNVQGVPIPHVKIYAVRTTLSSAVIQFKQVTLDTSDANGLVSFNLPQNARVWLQGQFFIGSASFSPTSGVPVDIPATATATLESLGAAVSAPTSGVTVTVDGVALPGLYTTFNFDSATMTVSSPSAGILDIASIGGGGTGTTDGRVVREIPSGSIDGSNATFVLDDAPTSDSEEVFLNGQLLTADVDYTISGSTITLIVVAHTGDSLVVSYETGTSSRIVRETPSGSIDGSNASFALGGTPVVNSAEVFLNGQLLASTVDYTLSGSTLTQILIPQTGDTFVVSYETDVTDRVVNETPTGSVDGSNATFVLAATPTDGSEEVFLNGWLLTDLTDYTISGATITMITIPETGDYLRVSYVS